MLDLQGMDALIAGTIGLLIGSFLNVVVHRLPRMMERAWASECHDYLIEQGQTPPALPSDRFNLLTPRSRCPHCGHAVRWYENIPVLSYLVLRGRCSACKTRISWRYPIVELSTAALFAFCAWRWGLTPTALAWCSFSAALLVLALIDWDTTLLPDSITLPLLWAGLLAALLRLTPVSTADALWGAMGGYLSLWTVYWAFKLATGKEGMGYGDFKLFAALGAWFGWTALVPIILVSSVIGALVGIGMKLFKNLREGGYVPFGPFLAGAGFAAMVFGPQTLLQRILGWIGL